ncbi:hypothetical protein TRVA0_015S00122 [Trichomonascus vanleenenianus]|uniref:Gfo/Idh/MocA family protein n=1 Tax=Trichomonascus vanleenenianus TaxID=2268995 RepID=UPI003ECA5338
MVHTTTVRWGILATGWIAEAFAKDILIDPTTRNVRDVNHEIVAVGSSNDVQKSRDFIKRVGASESTVAYGNYRELVNDPKVDVIYVATPHTYHYDNAKLAIEAGKHVLCEKPCAINAAQLNHLRKLAEEKGLFFMEAVWTRFFPLVLDLQRNLFETKIIGKIYRTFADLSVKFDIDNAPPSNRMTNPELGGGALLDLGIYALTWVFLINYADPDNQRQAPKYSGNIIKTLHSGVDEHTSITLAFEQGRTMAIATTSLTAPPNHDACIRIEGSEGVITVQWSPYQPASYTVYKYLANERLSDGDVRTFEIPVGRGMFWEADEVARCLKAGKLESDRIPLEESALITSIMDNIRYSNNFRYPEHLEAVTK